MANNSQKSNKSRKINEKFKRVASTKQEQPAEEKKISRRTILIFGIFVTLTLCVAGLANWRSGTFSNRANLNSLAPNGAVVSTTPPTLPAEGPSKEYIYA